MAKQLVHGFVAAKTTYLVGMTTAGYYQSQRRLEHDETCVQCISDLVFPVERFHVYTSFVSQGELELNSLHYIAPRMVFRRIYQLCLMQYITVSIKDTYLASFSKKGVCRWAGFLVPSCDYTRTS